MKATLELRRDTYTKKSTIGRLYLNDVYFCNTLEDVCRDLNKDGDLKDSGESKVFGETAIPAGTYKFMINMSNRFKTMMPLLMNVEGFEAIRIHSGNTDIDTHGCILLGLTRTRDGIGQSKLAFIKLMEHLSKYNQFEIIIKDEKVFK